jgi:NAD-dependent dihydropyrimidine dehydrogenase PreA subunit
LVCVNIEEATKNCKRVWEVCKWEVWYWKGLNW